MARISITKLTFGGSGLGEIEGKKVFVPFSAPGDVLEVAVTRDKGSFAEAEIIEVIEPAACRVEPQCPVFGECGGCQWQHLAYETQLEWKRIILAETLERIGGFGNPQVAPAIPSPKQWNYRNRIQLHVDKRGHVGFYRPGSHDVVAFERCFIADDDLNRQLGEHRQEFAKRDRGVALRTHDGPHFSQINAEQNENVKSMLLNWLEAVPHETIVELYAGSGNFTFPISTIASTLVALEIDGRAVSFARRRAASEGIEHIAFHCLPSEQLGKVNCEGSCDALFLNPPRKGASEALGAIMERKPATIIYMSCSPPTLARDLKVLAQNGWKLVKCQPIDMFPQTFHIEALAMLKRSS